MKALFDATQTLPEGLWFVKWIDRFSLGRGFTSSPRVRVFLQRLPFDDVVLLDRANHAEVGYLIGKRPGSDETLAMETRDLMAGALPLLRIGDVVREQRIVGRLRQREATITLEPGMPSTLVGIFDACPAPPDWTVGTFRVLNRFEYGLGSNEKFRDAKCLRVVTPQMEYLIPATVILKTFYAFHTKVANAVCSGSWETKCLELISTLSYESGIGTYVDPQAGDWNIVVQSGLTRQYAVRLALLYFDDYARQCANAIHSAALRQTHGLRADDERFWFADAQIPYRWDAQPFRMRVEGFPLRPVRPYSSEATRFLVTRIEATSWPFVDQVIHSELANSNALSRDANVKKANQPYASGKPPPVPAREDAEPDHQSDAYKHDADNEVAAEDFRFLNEPRHFQQVKRSHKEYRVADEPVPLPRAPKPILSAGNLAPGKDKPAPLVASSRNRHPSRQLQSLLNALYELADRGDVSSVEVLGPPEDSHLRLVRNGIACWSFLTEEQQRKLPGNAIGWPYLFDRPRGEDGPRRAYARSLLVLQVMMADRALLLFEVEPRPLEAGYRLYLCKPTEAPHWTSIEASLVVLKTYQGRLDEQGLTSAFRGLSPYPALAVNHSYQRDETDRIVGLNVAGLLRTLQRALNGEAPIGLPAAE